jgi:ribosome silencing factor RsfS/YbeB/iojap
MTVKQEAAIARTPKAPAGDETKPARRRSTAAKPAAPEATPVTATAKPKAAAPKAAAPKAAKPKVATPKAPAADGAAPAATKPATPRKRQVAAGPAAAPKPRPARRVKASPDRLEELVTAVCTSLEDDKAENILVLDVTDRASFTDRMIIATGLADRQIQAMADHLEDALEKVGLKLNRNAIQASPDWVLIDAGDLVVHLFKPEARAMYALERMWGPDSPRGEGSPGAA